MLKCATLVLLFCLACFTQPTVANKGVNHNSHYQKYWNNFKPAKYHYKKYVKWPKVRGRCVQPARWNLPNAPEPILESAANGEVSILFLMKRTCKFCISQLAALNQLAVYYRAIGQNVTFLVLNHRHQRLSLNVLSAHPMLNFYEESPMSDIFGSLRAGLGDILIYDVCGRQQYHFGYPYSWLGYQFVKTAIVNTMNHHETLCGECAPSLLLNGTATPPARTTTTSAEIINKTPITKL